MEGLTRGQLAQRAQINPETVRFYEQEGLLGPPSRTASGYRKFPETAIDRLAFVKRAKTLGFSLGEIRELLAIQDGHTDACAEVMELVQEQAGDCPEQGGGTGNTGSSFGLGASQVQSGFEPEAVSTL
jgi:MerR family mercuric resistance operon transcriptional regulator